MCVCVCRVRYLANTTIPVLCLDVLYLDTYAEREQERKHKDKCRYIYMRVCVVYA